MTTDQQPVEAASPPAAQSPDDHVRPRSSAPAPRKSRWSFSLLSLLLATGLVLAVVSHVRTSLRLEELRKTSDALEIASPRRIHVRRMNNTNHVLWRWRIFLSEGYHFYLHSATKGARDTKLPPPENSRMFDAHGEVIVDVFAADTMTGDLTNRSYIVTIMTDFAGGGSVTTRAPNVQPAPGHYLLDYDELAAGRTLSFDVDEPVVLIRGWKSFPPETPPAGPTEPGIILWIEKAKTTR